MAIELNNTINNLTAYGTAQGDRFVFSVGIRECK